MEAEVAVGGVSFLVLACGGCAFSGLGFSALEARAYFLLLRQKKVAKEKATPGSAPGCARSLALLAAGGGCGTRGCAPQTVLALFPPAAALLSASQGDPKASGLKILSGKRNATVGPKKRPKTKNPSSATDGLLGPLGGAEQRR